MEHTVRDVLPQVVEGVILQRQGDDYFVLDTNNGEVFRVNSPAARIFQCCQGRNTLEATISLLRPDAASAALDAEIRADVLRTLKQLQELGLCEPSVPG